MLLRPLANTIADGHSFGESLVKEALTKIADSSGQGSVAFRESRVFQAPRDAREMAEAGSKAGKALPLQGIPISVKDNISVEGSFRRAGSLALGDTPPEVADAPFVAKLKSLGLVVVGMTNMSEFAYSGLGLNANFGTPLSDVAAKRVAGGSSSGAAVSVLEGMVPVAIGTDTSGSVRIPAAMCGLAAFRPSQERYSNSLTIPLSPSFDSVGTIANSVDCLKLLDELVTGKANSLKNGFSPCLVVPTEASELVEADILSSFERCVDQLRSSGVRIVEQSLPELTTLRHCVSSANIVQYEAYQWHRELLAERAGLYDPLVAMRFRNSSLLNTATYTNGLAHLDTLRNLLDRILAGFDGMLMPTVPIPAPTLDELSSEENYLRINTLAFRNTSIANHLDLPSVCFPSERADKRAASVMLIGRRRHDEMALAIAHRLSKIIGETHDR